MASDGQDMLVSVVIPAYNAESCIAAALRSLQKQSIPLEVIVVNDGSTDSTQTVVEALCCRYPNITLINVENGGAGRARNIGIQYATGSYIAFLDSDDLYFVDSFNEEAAERIRQWLSEKVDVVMTPFTRTDMTLSERPIEGMPEQVSEVRHHMPRFAFWTCLFRREFLMTEQVRFPEYAAQDVETAFRYRACSSAKRMVSCRSWRFVLQRDNLSSNTHTWNEEVLYSVKARVYDDLYNEALDRSDCHDDLIYLESVRVNMLARYFEKVLRMGTTLENGLDVYRELYCLATKRAFYLEGLHSLGIRNRFVYLKDRLVVKKALNGGIPGKMRRASPYKWQTLGADSECAVPDIDEIMDKLVRLSKRYGGA